MAEREWKCIFADLFLKRLCVRVPGESVYLLCSCLEPSEEIDLINVAFEQRHVSDQSSGR